MTSGGDDLEQELRRNLKLRRELGAEAAKGKAALDAKQRGGVAYRLGWVLYWACLALIGLYATFFWWSYKTHLWRASSAILRTGLQSLDWPFRVVGLYALGRAFRYVLSGG